MKGIRECAACGLCANQPPLLQRSDGTAETMVVGLSAVRVDDVWADEPLSESTRSGAFIRDVLSPFAAAGTYFTNLVKCLPLRDGRIRYPTSAEVDVCVENLREELAHVRPRCIILLGRQVAEAIARHFDLALRRADNGTFPRGRLDAAHVLAAHHPSYTLVYRRKEMGAYRSQLRSFVRETTRTAGHQVESC